MPTNPMPTATFNSWRSIAVRILATTCLPLWIQASASGQVFTEDFEGVNPLDSFTQVDNEGTNDMKFSVSSPGSDGLGGDSGMSGNVGGAVTAAPRNTPGAWLQANGVALDPASDFTLTVDLRQLPEGTFDDVLLVFGDLGEGQYYTIIFSEVDENNDMLLYDERGRVGGGGSQDAVADGTNDAGEYATGVAEDTWFTATLRWTASTEELRLDLVQTGGTSVGGFAVTLDGNGTNNPSLTTMIGSGGIQFGFGTLNDNALFDNISIESDAQEEDNFRITDVQRNSDGTVTLTWNSLPFADDTPAEERPTYSVFFNPNLKTPFVNWADDADDVVSEGVTTTYTTFNSFAENRMFFFIELNNNNN